MGRLTYVCATCSEHFTRKYSARRHNQNLHNGAAEIVRLIDYLAGRSSGQYTPNNPFWFKRNNPYVNIGHATVADSISDTFQSRYIPHLPLDVSQDSVAAICRRMPSMESHGTGFPQETIAKIEELKRLVNRYAQYQNNDPDEIVRWAVHGAVNGNNTFLDEKLKQLSRLDSYNTWQNGHNIE